MSRIVRHLMTRPGIRRCPYCRKEGGEFPSTCAPCGWTVEKGPGRTIDPSSSIDISPVDTNVPSRIVRAGRVSASGSIALVRAIDMGAVGAEGS